MIYNTIIIIIKAQHTTHNTQHSNSASKTIGKCEQKNKPIGMLYTVCCMLYAMYLHFGADRCIALYNLLHGLISHFRNHFWPESKTRTATAVATIKALCIKKEIKRKILTLIINNMILIKISVQMLCSMSATCPLAKTHVALQHQSV